MCDIVYESQIKSLPLLTRGKVRDIYQADDRHLLMVASDRISAFDVILPQPIPGKGQILTQMATFWLQRMSPLVANHLADQPLEKFLTAAEIARLNGRGMVVKKVKPLPIEAVVRGYLMGSGWREYQHTGCVCGIPLPAGLQLAEKLPEVIFTPATKADVGDHDENISFAEMVARIGAPLAERVKRMSIDIYCAAAEYAYQRGIIIADTKFEFGLDDNDELILIDEVLTPDSSRFWSLKQYRPGMSPPSFDKQYVRDYLETLEWDKRPPGPVLTASVIEHTVTRYKEVAALLMRD